MLFRATALPSFEPDTHRGDYLRLTGLILAVGYVVFLPSWRVGVLLTLSSVAFVALTLNRDTLASYLLLFGPGVFGAIAAAMGFAGLGGKIAGAIGLLLVVSDRKFIQFLDRLYRPVLWMAWTGGVLTVWYFLGPRTEYCKNLWTGCFTNVPLAITGYAYLLWKRSVSWWTLGQLAVLSSLVLVAVGTAVTPSYLPEHILHLGVLREKITDSAFRISTHDLGVFSTMGALMVLYAKPDRIMRQNDRIQIAVTMGLAVIVLGWTFHRTSIVAFAAAVALASLVQSRSSRVYMTLSVLLLVALAIVLVLAATSDNSQLLAQQLDTHRSITARLNRSTNWNAALHCIQQKPWFGHGLGGFYIPGFSKPGGGTFAHNLFLGFLSELGILGTGLVLLPIFLAYWRVRGRMSLAMRSASGGAIAPVLMPVFLMVMASGDVVDHAAFLALVAVLLESWSKHV